MGAAETPVQKPSAKQEPKKSMRERALQRFDPKIKDHDGVDAAVRVENRDPERSYVWANERPVSANTAGDVAYYLSLAPAMGLEEADGYHVEVVPEPSDKNSVRAPGGLPTEPGSPITNVYGNVLMSCPIEFKKLVESLGTNLQSGQEGASKIENRMISNRGIPDDLRGIGRSGIFGLERDMGHYDTQMFSRVERG
jgi:hypothetical protein